LDSMRSDLEKFCAIMWLCVQVRTTMLKRRFSFSIGLAYVIRRPSTHNNLFVWLKVCNNQMWPHWFRLL
jgi:hypothetical protein